MRALLPLAFTCLLATPALSQIEVRFMEGAPKDRFQVSNVGGCPMGASQVTIDLAGSAGALVFDVTAAGAGVEVFQPFEVVTGADRLLSQPVVRDGDRAIVLDLSGMAPGEVVAFTIDVDDTIGAREITVTGGEIAGATVKLRSDGAEVSAAFRNGPTATLATTACVT